MEVPLPPRLPWILACAGMTEEGAATRRADHHSRVHGSSPAASAPVDSRLRGNDRRGCGHAPCGPSFPLAPTWEIDRATTVCRSCVAGPAEASGRGSAVGLAKRPLAGRGRPASDSRVHRRGRRLDAAPRRGRTGGRDGAQARYRAARPRMLPPTRRSASALDQRLAEGGARIARPGGPTCARASGTDAGAPQVHAPCQHCPVPPPAVADRAAGISRRPLALPYGTGRRRVVSPLLSERSDNSGYGNLMVMGT